MYDMREVRRKFLNHRGQAKQRGIEFKMTFDEWWEIWRPHWHNRGNKVGQFGMCRTMDKGAYEVGNVRIDTPKGNARTRSLVAYDRTMQVRKQEYVVHEIEEDEPEEEDSWLPPELRRLHTMSDMYEQV